MRSSRNVGRQLADGRREEGSGDGRDGGRGGEAMVSYAELADPSRKIVTDATSACECVFGPVHFGTK